MISKVITFALTFVANAAIGTVLFFFLIVALNGFAERDAHYAIGTYIAGAVLASLIVSSLAVLVLGWLIGRDFKPWIAGCLAVLAFSIVGGIIKAILILAATVVAEIVRSSR